MLNHLSRPIVVLDGLPGLYGLKYDNATACGLPSYLCSYKLVGSATPAEEGPPWLMDVSDISSSFMNWPI